MTYDELKSKQNINLLSQQLTNRISSVQIINEFSDDHIPCADVKFIFKDGIVFETSLYYLGGIGIGALYFFDSEKAQQYLTTTLFPNLIASYLEEYWDCHSCKESIEFLEKALQLNVSEHDWS